jgi:S-adenosylmethionine:tRNA ribosyltransferase-isomerase
MRPADRPHQRARDARLLAVDAHGGLAHLPRARFVDLLRSNDLLIANDAATMPASLAGVHEPSGGTIEVRLAARASLRVDAVQLFSAVVFGAGDFRTPTERRALPPALRAGDTLRLGPLHARVERLLGHPRLIELRFEGTADEIWAGLAHHGRPIQYAHVATPLALWDVWTRIAALPVAFEPPSAGFVLDWQLLDALRARDIGFATLTHAAGISSTGDATLDARLPFDEPYFIPAATVAAIRRTQAREGRVIALGTTVTRALEHAASRRGGLQAGEGLADQRIGADTRLAVIDALLTGTHEAGSSHHELMRAFAGQQLLQRIDDALERGGYRTHEFGDSVLLERSCGCRAEDGSAPALAAGACVRRRRGAPLHQQMLAGVLAAEHDVVHLA